MGWLGASRDTNNDTGNDTALILPLAFFARSNKALGEEV